MKLPPLLVMLSIALGAGFLIGKQGSKETGKETIVDRVRENDPITVFSWAASTNSARP